MLLANSHCLAVKSMDPQTLAHYTMHMIHFAAAACRRHKSPCQPQDRGALRDSRQRRTSGCGVSYRNMKLKASLSASAAAAPALSEFKPSWWHRSGVSRAVSSRAASVALDGPSRSCTGKHSSASGCSLISCSQASSPLLNGQAVLAAVSIVDMRWSIVGKRSMAAAGAPLRAQHRCHCLA